MQTTDATRDTMEIDTSTRDGADSSDGGDAGRDSGMKNPLCPEGSFEESPQCRDILPTDQAFRKTWEFGERRVADTDDFKLGVEIEIPDGRASGSIASKDPGASKVMVSLEGSANSVDFHLSPTESEPFATIKQGDSVVVAKSGAWSVLKGPDYQIATNEVRADGWQEACLATPAGFIDARLTTSCTGEYMGPNNCSGSKTPVQVFGLELMSDSDSASGNYIETVELGEWTGYLDMGVNLRPGSTPFCDRNGAYAAIVLYGPNPG